MPTVRKIAKETAPIAGRVAQREQQIASLMQRNDTTGLVVAAHRVLRAEGYQVQPHGLKWRVQYDGGEPTVLDTAALMSLAGGHDATLDAEIAERATQAAPAAPPSIPDTAAPAPVLVPLDHIHDNPYQPRLAYDAERITAIATSIREHGLLQVPLARPLADGRYQLAFGHSRARAFVQLAEQDAARFGRMPLIVRDLDDETMALHAWIENRDRKDLTCYEEARAIERYTSAFGWSQKETASKLQLDRSTVANKLRLLKLPESALTQLRDGELSERQAMALLPLTELPPSAKTDRRAWVGSTIGYVAGAEDLMSKAGDVDSGTLRSAVDTYLGELTIALAKQPWRGQAWEIPSVHAARCADCSIRLKSSDRCPDRACAGRKAAAWQQQQAAKASEKEGLPVTIHRSYSDRDDLSGVQLKAIRQVAEEKKCGNLAVLFDDDRAYYPHKAGGQEHCWIVCGHGPNRRCGCKQALARRADPATSEEAKKRHDRQRIKAELIAPAEQAVAAALGQPTAAVWRRLFKAINSHAASKLAADADIPTIQRALAAFLVTNEASYYVETSPMYGHAQSTIASLLHSLGAAIPWQAATPAPAAAGGCLHANVGGDPLGPIRARLDFLVQQIATWSEVAPTPETMAGYRGRLAELADELEALADAPDVEDTAYEEMAQQISAAEQALMGLAEAAGVSLESEAAS